MTPTSPAFRTSLSRAAWFVSAGRTAGAECREAHRYGHLSSILRGGRAPDLEALARLQLHCAIGCSGAGWCRRLPGSRTLLSSCQCLLHPLHRVVIQRPRNRQRVILLAWHQHLFPGHINAHNKSHPKLDRSAWPLSLSVKSHTCRAAFYPLYRAQLLQTGCMSSSKVSKIRKAFFVDLQQVKELVRGAHMPDK
jgi:hypothetical protein